MSPQKHLSSPLLGPFPPSLGQAPYFWDSTYHPHLRHLRPRRLHRLPPPPPLVTSTPHLLLLSLKAPPPEPGSLHHTDPSDDVPLDTWLSSEDVVLNGTLTTPSWKDRCVIGTPLPRSSPHPCNVAGVSRGGKNTNNGALDVTSAGTLKYLCFFAGKLVNKVVITLERNIKYFCFCGLSPLSPRILRVGQHRFAR
jgi:hypothetical protein